MKKFVLSACAALCIALFAAGCARVLESDLSAALVQAVAGTEDNFRESYRINAYFLPDDLELYEQLLPEQFGMPEHPLVQVIMLDQVDVGPWPLTPYKEGSVNLRVRYGDEEGWYITLLPVSKWVAMYAGRTMGYNKYLADEVTFEEKDGGWISEVYHKDALRLSAEFTPGEWPSPPVWLEQGWDLGGPVFNLMPPGQGPEVIRVESSNSAPEEVEAVEGTVKVMIGRGEPWYGLIADGAESPGQFLHVTGSRSLKPEKG